MSRNTSSSAAQQDQFLTGLQSWVNAAPNGENGAREIARIRIIEARNSSSTWLDLRHLRLTSLPAEIGNLSRLLYLNLDGNELTSLPPEIANLGSLQMLSISGNRLTSIPDSIITGTRSSFLLGIHAENNHFSQTEVARLTSLATGRSVSLNISIYDPFVRSPSTLNTTIDSITNKILLKALEENRTTLGSFLRSEEGVSSDFKRFLTECPRTQSYRTNPDQMIQSLYEITDKMRQNSDVKAKCETLATTAFGTCGDRVGLAFVQMQLSLNQSGGKVLEMNTEELFTYAKQEAVVKFLSDKSQEKIDYIKTRGGVLDEIETHLAYLQAAPDFGVSLASGMLYRGCSNVTEQDLVMAKAEFNSEPIEQRVAKHLYEDGELRTAPFVQKIITEISDMTEFNTDAKTGESDGDYQERLKNLRAEFAKSVTEEIAKGLKESGLIERLREEIASAPPSVFVTGANILNAASQNNRSRNL